MVKDDSWFLKTAIIGKMEAIKDALHQMNDEGLEMVLEELEKLQDKIRDGE